MRGDDNGMKKNLFGLLSFSYLLEYRQVTIKDGYCIRARLVNEGGLTGKRLWGKKQSQFYERFVKSRNAGRRQLTRVRPCQRVPTGWGKGNSAMFGNSKEIGKN